VNKHDQCENCIMKLIVVPIMQIIWSNVIIITSKFVVECLAFPINKQLYVGAYKCHMWGNHYDRPTKNMTIFFNTSKHGIHD